MRSRSPADLAAVLYRRWFIAPVILLAALPSSFSAPGDKKWEFATGGAIRSSPALGDNGLICFGSLDGKVYALDGTSGTKRWETSMLSAVLASPAIADDGTIYVSSSDGRVAALNEVDGVPLWTRQLPETLSSPVLGNNGLLYVATRDEGLYALDRTTGQVVWRTKLDNWRNVYASPSVGHDGMVFCASGGPEASGAKPRFFALDEQSGRIRWRFASVNLVQATPAIGADATVFVPSYDKFIYALDSDTGTRKWEHRAADGLSSSAALGSDGTLYVGGNDGRLYALDAETGSRKWTFLTGDTIHSTPAVADDQTVYFGSYDKNVYALDGKTGAEEWRFATGGLVLSSPVLTPDGTVLIGSYDGKLYALEGSAPLAQSPWPAFKGGARRTGRAGPSGPRLSPSLKINWNEAAREPLLRVRGEPGAGYHLLAAPNVDGPWELASGLRLTSPEAQWIDSTAAEAATRFYRLAVASTLEMEPFASNFRLLDLTGRSYELYYHTQRKGVAVIAAGERLENLARFVDDLNALHAEASSQGVEIWVVLSDASTPRRELLERSQALGLKVPVLLDRDCLAARMLGVDRAAEAVLVRAPDFVTAYRGTVREGNRFYLREAVFALIAGQRPEVWRTRLQTPRLASTDGARLTYSEEIAPILQTYCVRCHRPNTAAPFSFNSFADVRDRAAAIRHQVISGNMPPWHADPEFGQFANNFALPSAARQKLIAWLDAGAPRDGGSDPLEQTPIDTSAGDLIAALGPPDAVITLPVQSIQATGFEPYRTVQVPAPNESNVWLRAVSLTPGNPAVVHHYTAYQPLSVALVGRVNLGFGFYVPGREARAYPEGTGMFLQSGTTILFEMHYTPIGSEASDQPSLRLWYHRERPPKRFRSFTIINSEFKIPPGAPEHPVTARHQFTNQVTLHALACHMHLRGRSMVIESIDPSGVRETLLSVPHYHFHWQTRYELAQPRILSPGTVVEVRGTFDNSPQNPHNPDPTWTVSWGDQSWEEMFMGILEISE